MKLQIYWINLANIVCIILLLFGSAKLIAADPDPSEEFYHRIPQNRDEVKCYDESGRPQVSNYYQL